MTLQSAVRAYMDAVAGYVEAHGAHMYAYIGNYRLIAGPSEDEKKAASERLNAADEALREAMDAD